METRVPNGEGGGVADAPAQPRDSAGDPIPPKCQVIEVHVAELNQLFNAIDPAPFRQRDLDPDAEDFIVGWAREVPADAPLALVVHLDRPAGLPEEPAILRDAIREFFGQRAEAARRRLRQLFRRGRTSLVIGIAFLAVSLLLGDIVARLLGERRGRNSAGELCDRRLGRHVAADGGVSVRLVADPSGCPTCRQAERDACEDFL